MGRTLVKLLLHNLVGFRHVLDDCLGFLRRFRGCLDNAVHLFPLLLHLAKEVFVAHKAVCYPFAELFVLILDVHPSDQLSFDLGLDLTDLVVNSFDRLDFGE